MKINEIRFKTNYMIECNGLNELDSNNNKYTNFKFLDTYEIAAPDFVEHQAIQDSNMQRIYIDPQQGIHSKQFIEYLQETKTLKSKVGSFEINYKNSNTNKKTIVTITELEGYDPGYFNINISLDSGVPIYCMLFGKTEGFLCGSAYGSFYTDDSYHEMMKPDGEYMIDVYIGPDFYNTNSSAGYAPIRSNESATICEYSFRMMYYGSTHSWEISYI